MKKQAIAKTASLTLERAEPDRQTATTLARGLDILRCFTVTEPVLGNKEIAQRARLPRSTVSRLTESLTELGYLRHLPRAGKYGKYQLGAAVISMGYPLLANMNVRQVARLDMEELADYAQGWVSIGVRERLNMVYVETARARGTVDSKPDIGQTFPIVRSAMGRAYLAGLTEEERQSLINQVRIKTPELWAKYGGRVQKSLADFQQTGACYQRGDFHRDIHSVAVPMKHHGSDLAVVFNCAVPVRRLQRRQLENDLGPRLIRIVRAAESALTQR